jgi:hypothetical protein
MKTSKIHLIFNLAILLLLTSYTPRPGSAQRKTNTVTNVQELSGSL